MLTLCEKNQFLPLANRVHQTSSPPDSLLWCSMYHFCGITLFDRRLTWGFRVPFITECGQVMVQQMVSKCVQGRPLFSPHPSLSLTSLPNVQMEDGPAEHHCSWTLNMTLSSASLLIPNRKSLWWGLGMLCPE